MTQHRSACKGAKVPSTNYVSSYRITEIAMLKCISDNPQSKELKIAIL